MNPPYLTPVRIARIYSRIQQVPDLTSNWLSASSYEDPDPGLVLTWTMKSSPVP